MKEFNVVVNKKKLYKLIYNQKYKDINNYIMEQEKTINDKVISNLSLYLKNNFIYKEEDHIFKEIIYQNIIKEMLLDTNNIFINSYILKELINKQLSHSKMRDLVKSNFY